MGKAREKKIIPVFRPCWNDDLIDNVIATIKSGWWGSGPKAKQFEEEFAAYLGVDAEQAISLNSATAALHLAGKILDLPEGSEVITTPITFVSTGFLASYNRLSIKFADVLENSLNIDPASIVKLISDKTKVLLIVHYGGYACKMDEILEIARKHNLILIEDTAHAAGSEYKGRKLGTFGDMSCFSFQAVKNLAVGDGGMLVINNKENLKKWATRAKRLRWVGISRDTSERTSKDQYTWEYDITEVGYKYQMPDIAAAMGLAQLKSLDMMNSRRKEIVEKYNKEFNDVPWIKTPKKSDGEMPSYLNYCIRLEDQETRDSLAAYLKERGISTSVHYKPLYLHKVYEHVSADCPVADEIWKRILLLPIFPDLTPVDQDFIIQEVKRFKI